MSGHLKSLLYFAFIKNHISILLLLSLAPDFGLPPQTEDRAY